jgi:tripartite-type tricarboxylate transporter receptor subunit TctC
MPRTVFANKWPSKPIRFVCAQAPGASTDGTARAFADYMSTHLGVAIAVENKPGGAGMIAAESVARSAPDGYTFLITLHSQLAQAPVLLKKPPINPDTELLPIGEISTGRGVMVARKDLPARTFPEVIEMSKKQPVSVGNYSIGSGWQLLMAEVARQTGAKFNMVNYRGTGLMVPDLLGSQIDIGAGSMAGLGNVIERGGVKALMFISGGKSPRYPDLVTWDDLGFKGEAFTALNECNMMLAPAGLPKPIADRMAALFLEAVDKSARVRALRHTLVADDRPLVGKELQDFIKMSWPVYRRLSTELGLAGTL